MKNRNYVLIFTGILFLIFIGYGAFQQLTAPDADPVIPVENPVAADKPAVVQPVEPVQTAFHLFFPYDTGTDFALKEVTALVVLAENESPLARLQELLKEPSNMNAESTPALVPLLGPDAEILSVEVLETATIKVNVNREFITQMNAGASLEGTIIRAFVKSLAALYNVTGVILQVDGGPYESGHYFFGDSDIIGVNDEL